MAISSPRESRALSERMQNLAVPIIALVCILLSPASGSSKTPASPPPQFVAVWLEPEDGKAILHASSTGSDYVIDPQKFSFSIVPHDDPTASERPLITTVGPPVAAPAPIGALQHIGQYTMTIAFSPPDQPGLYDVRMSAADGFARLKDGTALPLGDPRQQPQPWEVTMWWPDEHGDDATLATLAKRFVGKDIYGFGGITVGCGASWGYTYDAATPIRVRAVERDRGQFAELWPGSTANGGSDDSPHFLAADPLRIVVALPAARPSGTFGSRSGSIADCPAIVLADWQVDVTIATGPPPALPNNNAPYPAIKVGMFREDVAWRIGYPHEFGARSELDRENVWSYANTTPFGFSVTFRDNKVSSYTTPGNLP
jgi:hypothetical protein